MHCTLFTHSPLNTYAKILSARGLMGVGRNLSFNKRYELNLLLPSPWLCLCPDRQQGGKAQLSVCMEQDSLHGPVLIGGNFLWLKIILLLGQTCIQGDWSGNNNIRHALPTNTWYVMATEPLALYTLGSPVPMGVGKVQEEYEAVLVAGERLIQRERLRGFSQEEKAFSNSVV